MRRAGGYMVIAGPDGPSEEWDTFTCAHCQRVVRVPAKADPSKMGGFCIPCFKHICGQCADAGTCTPFLRKVEQQEARSRLLKSIGEG